MGLGEILDWRYRGIDTVPTTTGPDPDMPNLTQAPHYTSRRGHDVRVSQMHSLRDLIIDNRRLIGAKWGYISLAQPTGMETPAEALYQFTDAVTGLIDQTGNGHTLQSNSTTVYQPLDDMFCAGFNRSNYLHATGTTGALQIDGALTIEIVAQLNNIQGGSTYRGCLVNCGASLETEPDNVLYSLISMESSGRINYTAENGAGINSDWTSYAMFNSGKFAHTVLTRSEDGTTIKLYTNGILSEETTGLTKPTGGSNGVFRVGTNQDLSKVFHGYIGSVKITPDVYTAAMALEAYEAVSNIGASL